MLEYNLQFNDIRMKSNIIGKKFSIATPDFDQFKVNNLISRDLLKKLLEVMDLSEYSNDELNQLIEIAKRDLTINNVLCSRYGMELEIASQDQLVVSLVDFGWDSRCEVYSETIDIFDHNDQYESHGVNMILDCYITINYFDYYCEVTNRVCNALDQLMDTGSSQECYEGWDYDYFISGYDIGGGSIFMHMPIGGIHEYVIKEPNGRETPKRSEFCTGEALFIPKTFYGPDTTHFYNTNYNKRWETGCSCMVDIRLD